MAMPMSETPSRSTVRSAIGPWVSHAISSWLGKLSRWKSPFSSRTLFRVNVGSLFTPSSVPLRVGVK